MFKLEPGQITFHYTNYKGVEKDVRAEIHGIHWGTSEYYPTPGWLMEGIDLDRNVRRTYSAYKMSDVVHLT